jgi:hypothetical protein
MKQSNVGFDKLCNILEKKYVSYRNNKLSEPEDTTVFAVNPPVKSRLHQSFWTFLIIDRLTEEVTIYDPVEGFKEPYFGYQVYIIHLADVSDPKFSVNSVISKIDNNLKIYHDMKKQLLKNKVERL